MITYKTEPPRELLRVPIDRKAPLVVEVRGQMCSGKSVVAVAIAKALCELGFEVELTDDDSPNSFMNKHDQLEKFVRSMNQNELRVVKIQTGQLRRSVLGDV